MGFGKEELCFQTRPLIFFFTWNNKTYFYTTWKIFFKTKKQEEKNKLISFLLVNYRQLILIFYLTGLRYICWYILWKIRWNNWDIFSLILIFNFARWNEQFILFAINKNKICIKIKQQQQIYWKISVVMSKVTK